MVRAKNMKQQQNIENLHGITTHRIDTFKVLCRNCIIYPTFNIIIIYKQNEQFKANRQVH